MLGQPLLENGFVGLTQPQGAFVVGLQLAERGRIVTSELLEGGGFGRLELLGQRSAPGPDHVEQGMGHFVPRGLGQPPRDVDNHFRTTRGRGVRGKHNPGASIHPLQRGRGRRGRTTAGLGSGATTGPSSGRLNQTAGHRCQHPDVHHVALRPLHHSPLTAGLNQLDILLRSGGHHDGGVVPEEVLERADEN